MATQVQFRGGSSTEHSSFTGAAREVTVDTTKDTIVVHDGSTAGGHPLAKENNPSFTGNVGIGTDSPSAKLEIKNTSSGNAYLLDLRADAAAQNGLVRMITRNAADSGTTSVDFYKQYQSGLYINNNDADSSNFTSFNIGTSERLRIDSAGNVGIGTSSPLAKIHIKNATESAGPVSSANASLMLTSQKGTYTANYYTSNIVWSRPSSNGGTPTAFIGLRNVDAAGNSGALAFGASANTTVQERMCILPDGNVGIGTITPIAKLSVNGQAHIDKPSDYWSSTSSYYDVAGVGGLATQGAFAVHLTSNGYRGADSEWVSLETNSNTGAAQIQVDPTGTIGFNTEAAKATGDTATVTRRMTIANNGNVGINVSVPTAKLHVNGQAFFPANTTFNNVSVADISVGTVNGKLFSSSAGILYSSRDALTTANHNFFLNPNGIIGSISTTGSATAYTTSSDYRLKENVVDLTGAIDRVNQLQVRRFNFIADPDKTVDGFIAHEAQEVVPESVTGTKDGTEAVGTLTEWDGTVIETDVTEPESLTWDETITDEENNETIETRTRTWVKTGDRPVMQGIDQAKLVPLLTAALQEALSAIETLKTKVAALEAAN